MTKFLSGQQEAQVRAIVAEMIGQALRGAGERISHAIAGSVVLLPIVHGCSDAVAGMVASHGNADTISTGEASA